MTDGFEGALSDDELIARLRRASPEPSHDPFFDIPVADEVDVPGDGAFHGPGAQCAVTGSRKTAIQGAYGVLVTEPIKCELKAGHGGAHRAGFRRTHVLHHWKAYEWSSSVRPPDRARPDDLIHIPHRGRPRAFGRHRALPS